MRRGQDCGRLSDRTFRIVSRPQRGDQSADRGLREDGVAVNQGATGGFPAPARNFPAVSGKIPCPAAAGNSPKVTGHSASTQSGTADAAPNPKKFPAKFAASREVEDQALAAKPRRRGKHDRALSASWPAASSGWRRNPMKIAALLAFVAPRLRIRVAFRAPWPSALSSALLHCVAGV